MGSSRVEIYRITDFTIPLDIMSSPEVYPVAYEDTAEIQVPDVVNEYWLGAHANAIGTIGCYRVHSMGKVLWQVHARILKDYRAEYAYDSSKALLQWVAQNIKNFSCLMCYVPELNTNVYNHAVSVGFHQIGTLPTSYLKDGKLIDQDILAITKEEILCPSLLSPLLQL